MNIATEFAGCALMQSPIGRIVVLTTRDAVARLLYVGAIPAEYSHLRRNSIARDAIDQLDTYFSNHQTKFKLKLIEAPSDFQKKVRQQLFQIKSGTTASYGEIARRIHSGSRAVGTACRRNPVPIIVPCHRVIGSDQNLRGYYRARGGDMLNKKLWLLEHEGAR